MSGILQLIRELIARGEVLISLHGYEELAADDIAAADIMMGVSTALTIEDYPEYPKGPCVLVLEYDSKGKPIHVVWGIPKAKSSPAVLVTAYRPNAEEWTDDFRRRKR